MKKIILTLIILYTTNSYAMGLKDFCVALQTQNYDYLVSNTNKNLLIKNKDDDELTYVTGGQIKNALINTAKEDGGFDDDGTNHIEYLKDKSCEVLDETHKTEFMFGSFHLIKVDDTYKIDYVFK